MADCKKCGEPESAHRYNQCPGNGASLNPLPGQQAPARRSTDPLSALRQTDFYGLTGPMAMSIELHIAGKCRRRSDGAMGKLGGLLSQDQHGTIRTNISVPLDPDFGGLKGNVINRVDVTPRNSMWVHAPIGLSLHPKQADLDWDALGLHGIATKLLRGVVLCAHDGTEWECLADNIDARLIYADVCKIERAADDPLT